MLELTRAVLNDPPPGATAVTVINLPGLEDTPANRFLTTTSAAYLNEFDVSYRSGLLALESNTTIMADTYTAINYVRQYAEDFGLNSTTVLNACQSTFPSCHLVLEVVSCLKSFLFQLVSRPPRNRSVSSTPDAPRRIPTSTGTPPISPPEVTASSPTSSLVVLPRPAGSRRASKNFGRLIVSDRPAYIRPSLFSPLASL